jgi:hypothetical protein
VSQGFISRADDSNPCVANHSRTGIVYNVTKSAVGVIVYKVVGNRYLEKRVNLRVEHVRHSKCRQEFLDRVKRNHDAHVIAKEKGGKYQRCFLPLLMLMGHRASDLEAYSCTAKGVSHCLYIE